MRLPAFDSIGRTAHVSAELEGLESGSLSAPALAWPRRHLSCALVRRLLSFEQEAWLCWLHRLYTLQVAVERRSKNPAVACLTSTCTGSPLYPICDAGA